MSRVFRSRMRAKSLLFGALMLLAALAAVLPLSWSRFPRGFVQPLSWAQRPVSRVASLASVEATGGAVDDLQQRIADLELLVAQQSDLLAGREVILEQLSGLRQQFPDSSCRIILGRVEAVTDADTARDTLKISPGALRGVRRGDWVAAGLRRGEEVGDRSGRDLLLRRWLIGRVVETDQHTSRVQLCSDPRAKTTVVAARLMPDGRWQASDEVMMLVGNGRGRMRVNQATANYFEQGALALLAVAGADLPTRMVVGRITAGHPMVESALHFWLEVEPWEKGLPSSVFIISMSSR